MFIHYFFRIVLASLLFITGFAKAQNRYRYTVDLNKLTGDKLNVELLVPKLAGSTVVFSFPKIIPGTYSISDYGKFITNVKAFDKAGKALAVFKTKRQSVEDQQCCQLVPDHIHRKRYF